MRRGSAIALTIAAAISAAPAKAGPEDRFPIAVSADGRGLVTADGAPFRIHGDTAWSLIAGVPLAEAERYLDDRAARGFNTVLVNLIEARFAPNAPANAAGVAPFAEPDAFDAPNPAYFDHAARVIEAARARGLLVLLTPAYAGIGGGEQGWWASMEAAGPDALAAYGAFLGERLGALDNIVFVHGGDFDPPDRRLVRAVADALAARMPWALQTVHGGREAPVDEVWGEEPWIDLDTLYTYGSIREATLTARARDSGRPLLLVESLYENERDTPGRRLRAQAWEAVLGGAAGHVFGANPVWHFGAGGVFSAEIGWEEALDSPGARDMARMAEILDGLPCPALVPDPGLAPLLAGAGRGATRASLAACAGDAPDGVRALAYLPRADGVALDPARFPDGASARWLDPTAAHALPAGAAGRRDRRLDLADPGPNARGDPDWILAVDAPSSPGGEP